MLRMKDDTGRATPWGMVVAGLVGIALGLAIVVVCLALSIPLDLFLFALLMFLSGLYGPEVFRVLTGRLRR